MYLVVIISLLCLLGMNGAAVWRVVKEKSWKSIAVLVASLCYSVIYACGILRFMGFLNSDNDILTLIEIQKVSKVLYVAVPAVFSLFHVFTACAIGVRMSLGKYILSVTICFIFLSIASAIIFKSSIIYSLFVCCCGIMAAVAYALGLTYKEFCVIGNIYVQCAVLMWSGLYLLYVVIKMLLKKYNIYNIAICIVAVLHNITLDYIVCWLCVRYKAPLEPAFDICYRDLNFIATHFGSTYMMVNIVLFIIVFLAIVILNIVSEKLLHHKQTKPVSFLCITTMFIVEIFVVIKYLI